MNRTRTQRRGVVLLLAVMLMAIMAGLLSVIALETARLHQQRQADRVRAAVSAVSDSAVAYARLNVNSAPASRPSEPVELDVTSLLPKPMAGSANLTFPNVDGSVCRVTVRASLGGQSFERVTDVSLSTPPTTAPAQ